MVERVREGVVLLPWADNLLQVGSSSEHSFVLSGLDEGTTTWLRRLLSRRDIPPLPSLTPDQLRLVGLLRSHGLVETRRSATVRDLHLRVVGLSRTTILFTRLAATSGVSFIDVRDAARVDEEVELLFGPDDLGSLRTEALKAELSSRRVAVGRSSRPHLVVSAERRVVDDQRAAQLLRADLIQLPIVADDRTIQIGPLLVPDLSPCHMCLEFHRRDCLPTWAKARKLLLRTPLSPPELPLAAAAAGLALHLVQSVLTPALRAGAGLPTWALGTAWRLTESGVEETRWDFHPDCGCRAQHMYRL
ncbi:hypothetical protein [Scrofimicrobium sp. R131]|uniref:THIF-type NAD/FAD binding fold domain-containing protein n=1 Tax=Scrofimicrobium appendicitidis TaxID=3079930 RepID=A0AAU7V5J7_9ACTO